MSEINAIMSSFAIVMILITYGVWLILGGLQRLSDKIDRIEKRIREK